MTNPSIEDDDRLGDPYGVAYEPDDPEQDWDDRCVELRQRYPNRWEWFRGKAKRANRRAETRGDAGIIEVSDVASIFDAAGGRCHYCGSLANQACPIGPWAHIGRRIGSLDHIDAVGFKHPGAEVETYIWNVLENLVWCCHWCNTHPTERRSGATDHGGLRPGAEKDA